MNDAVRSALLRMTERRPTPCFAYFVDDIVQRMGDLRSAMLERETTFALGGMVAQTNVRQMTSAARQAGGRA